MQNPSFTDRSVDLIQKKNSILCVGLDPQLDLMPPHLCEQFRKEFGPTFEAIGRLFFAFNKAIIDEIVGVAVWVKPQMAFYEVYGQWGVWAFEQTVAYARSKGLLVITDAKRGDGSDTARAYAQGHVGRVPFWPDTDSKPTTEVSPIRVDAVTIHGYIGDDCVLRFVEQMKKEGTCCFVVDKTSFKPNSTVEQLRVLNGDGLLADLEAELAKQNPDDPNRLALEPGLIKRLLEAHTRPVWQELARLVAKWGEGTEGECNWRNLGVVMGATYPEDTPRMREILPRSWFLVPGYGAQGGGADGAVVGADKNGFGITVNSSRGILYAYREGPFAGSSESFSGCALRAAVHARNDLNEALKRADKGWRIPQGGC